jgi:signal transduction histidine kinase
MKLASNMPSSPSPETLPPPERAASNPLSRLLIRLTEPHSALQGRQARRHARMLAMFSLCLLLINLTSAPAFLLVNLYRYPGLSNPILPLIAGWLIALGAAYGLSRGRWHTAGAVGIMAAAVSGILWMAYAPASNHPIYIFFIVLLVPIYILILPLKPALLTAGLLLIYAFSYILLLHIPIERDSFIALVSSAVLSLPVAGLSASLLQREEEQMEQITDQLADSLRQIMLVDQMKDQFLTNTSHELRTPLNAISGFTDVMLMGLTGELTADTRFAVERIHHNSERLAHLINDILDMSHIEAGHMEVKRQAFSPTQLLEDSVRSVQLLADARHLALRQHLDPALPATLIGDADRLEQILVNLLSNALKFTHEGTVSVSLQRSGADRWQIRVQDTGIGIPPESQADIFEKFRRIKPPPSRIYGGIGLGLTITRELAHLMDGSIHVASEVGRGSTFTVSLPLIIELEEHGS